MSDHGFAGVHRAFRPQSLLRHPADGKEPITSAYSLESNASMLYIPLKGRERTATLSQAEHDAVVDEVLARILAARDPVSGVSPVLEGGRRETLFPGPLCGQGAGSGVYPAAALLLHQRGGGEGALRHPRLQLQRPSRAARDPHRRRSPCSPGGGWRGGQSLIDIAPTLMYLGGAPVPGYMEGQVLSSLFTPAWSAARIRWCAKRARRRRWMPKS